MASGGEREPTSLTQKKRHNETKRPRPEAKAILRGHVTPVTSLCFHQREEHAHVLFTGDESGCVRIWDTRFEETLRVVNAPQAVGMSPVQGVAQHEERLNEVLVQYKNGFVARLDVEYHKNVGEFDAIGVRTFHTVPGVQRFVQHEEGAVLCDGFCRICYVNADTWVGACADGDECIIIRDERVGGGADIGVVGTLCRTTTTASGKGGMVMAVCSAGEMDLLAGYEDGSVGVWDLRNRKTARSLVKVGGDAVMSVACSPRGRVGVAGGAFDEIIAFGDVGEESVSAVAKASLQVSGICEVRWRPDGKLIASGGWDGVVRIWDGRRRQKALLRRVASLRWHEGSVLCLAYSSDSRMLASGGKDCTIAVWERI